tara:strand:+ start:1212 stop:1400 length:189 start_codon:yes stop_codon:yes gene_type:complete
MKMYSQIIAIEEGTPTLYINATKKEHQLTVSSLIFEGFKKDYKLKKLSNKIFDCWYLYQELN